VVNCSQEPTDAEIDKAITEAANGGPNTPVIFDEFNRLDANRLQELVNKLDQSDCWACFSCNCSDGMRDYDWLVKRCERIAMTRPELPTIASVMLGSEGLIESDALGSSLISLQQHLVQQCTKQPQYDFGLRKIKSLVKAAGIAARDSGFVQDEATLVATVCFNTLLPMLISQDRALLAPLIEQSFGVTMATAPERSTAAMLHDVLRERHSAAMVGSHTGAMLQLNQASLDHAVTKLPLCNTMADMSIEQLYSDTGAFASALRAAEQMADREVWLVVQVGKIAADLVHTKFEPLNTLMDDNKLLTTSTGTQVRLAPNTRLVFVFEDMKQLPPATVSRLGVVSVEESEPCHEHSQDAVTLMLKVKMELNGDIRRCSVGSLSDLRAAVRRVYSIDSFSLKYRDNEADNMTLETGADFAEARSMIQQHTETLRIIVVHK